MNIVALDIDDCILPSSQMWFGDTKDCHDMLEINLKRLVMMCDKYDMKIFITSSWYSILTLKDGVLDYKLRADAVQGKPYYRWEYQAYLLIEKYLQGRIIGLSCGNRFTDIRKLDKDGHKVIAMDDMNLSELESDNVAFVYTTGFIDGLCGYKTHLFMTEGKKYENKREKFKS